MKSLCCFSLLSSKGRTEQNRTSCQNRPALCNWTWGCKTASSSFRCRHSSSSYSAIVLSNSSNISSAAAVSRCFTKTLSVWTLDIFTESQQNFSSTDSTSGSVYFLRRAKLASLAPRDTRRWFRCETWWIKSQYRVHSDTGRVYLDVLSKQFVLYRNCSD